MEKKGNMNVGMLITIVGALLVLGVLGTLSSKITSDVAEDFCNSSCVIADQCWNGSGNDTRCVNTTGRFVLNNSVAWNVSQGALAGNTTLGENMSLIMLISVVTVILGLLIGAFVMNRNN